MVQGRFLKSLQGYGSGYWQLVYDYEVCMNQLHGIFKIVESQIKQLDNDDGDQSFNVGDFNASIQTHVDRQFLLSTEAKCDLTEELLNGMPEEMLLRKNFCNAQCSSMFCRFMELNDGETLVVDGTSYKKGLYHNHVNFLEVRSFGHSYGAKERSIQ